MVHSLMALAFLGNPPGKISASKGGWQVNHIDGVKTNNNICNLEYVTKEGNMRHGFALGLIVAPVGAATGMTSLTDQDVRDIRAAHAQGESQASIRRRYGIGSATISYMINRRTWKHVA